MRYRRDTSGTVNVQRGTKKILNKSRKPQYPLFLRVKHSHNSNQMAVRNVRNSSWLLQVKLKGGKNSLNQKYKIQTSGLIREVKLLCLRDKHHH